MVLSSLKILTTQIITRKPGNNMFISSQQVWNQIAVVENASNEFSICQNRLPQELNTVIFYSLGLPGESSP